MPNSKEQKISRRGVVMRMILAAIIVSLLAIFGVSIYKDNQGGSPRGVLEVYPESTLKAIRDLG